MVRRDDEIFIVDDAAGKALGGLAYAAVRFSVCRRRTAVGLYKLRGRTRPERVLAAWLPRPCAALSTARAAEAMLSASLYPPVAHCITSTAVSALPLVFYCDEERYTSLTRLCRWRRRRGRAAICRLRRPSSSGRAGSAFHSEADFKNILSDLTFESGREVVFVDGSDGAKACLFAAYDASRADSVVLVRSLMADTG